MGITLAPSCRLQLNAASTAVKHASKHPPVLLLRQLTANDPIWVSAMIPYSWSVSCLPDELDASSIKDTKDTVGLSSGCAQQGRTSRWGVAWSFQAPAATAQTPLYPGGSPHSPPCSLPAGPDLHLRAVHSGHAQEHFDLVQGSREHLLPWLAWVQRTRDVSDSKFSTHLREDMMFGLWSSDRKPVHALDYRLDCRS